MKLCSLKYIALVLSFLGLVNSSFAQPINGSEVRGIWKGTLHKTYDSCGVSDTELKIKHRVQVPSAGPILSLNFTDQWGRRSWVLIPYVGKVKDGGFFQALSGRWIKISADSVLGYEYRYTKIRNGGANVWFYTKIINVNTNASCEVLFTGRARRQ